MRTLNHHVYIENISPSVDGGLYPVKRVVGDTLVVQADMVRDGHEKICAALEFCDNPQSATRHSFVHRPDTTGHVAMRFYDNDRWQAQVVLSRQGPFCFRVVAWTDLYETWLEELGKKVQAGLEVPSEVAEGVELITSAHQHAHGVERKLLAGLIRELDAAADNPAAALALAAAGEVRAAVHQYAPRTDLVLSPTFWVTVDRGRAAFSAWYELFVRSQGRTPGAICTFNEAQRRLPDIRAMGFDVIYLAPIHPIGESFRKGPNNSLTCGPNDPGCPWAIGSRAGGHTAIDPALGSLDHFDAFVAGAHAHGIEIAMDFAVQCSPDHPWVTEHPEWFSHRPDGTIKYAENPPKKYQDVYPVNFDIPDKDALWQALLNVLLFWAEHGVRIFRVDNPHTKPFAFWQWAIAETQKKFPDVIFLAEAFTRPKVMKLLAKLGFTQSYTYFTWRNTGAEITEYLEELTQAPMRDFYRPNFFINTPDILPEVLQTGGRPAFRLRLVLAATLAPVYGIYSGYELCENAALPGHKEDYLDSEKYVVRVRDWDAPGNIKPLIAKINQVRREHPALQVLANLTFLRTDNPQLLFYGKKTGDDTLLIVVNLDPFSPHHGTVFVPAAYLGLGPDSRYEVVDLLSGAAYDWGQMNYVRLDPAVQAAHILWVKPVA